MMKVINKVIKLIKVLIKNPLSILRFLLAILFTKKLVGYIYFIEEIKNNSQYPLSKTWFTSLLPNSMFNLDVHFLYQLKLVVIIVGLLATVGIIGRLSLFLLSLLSFYILGIVEGIGVFDHHLSLPSQVILILTFIPGTLKLSVDNFIHSLFKNKKTVITDTPKWSVNLILAVVVLTYFAAGVSKLRYGNGLNWLDGSTLSFYLKEQTLKYKEGQMQLIIGDNKISEENKWKDSIGFKAHAYGNFQLSKKRNAISTYIANNKTLVILLSIGSVLFELLGFIVFINSKYRNLYLISAILFHLSIGALMGISFRQYRLICLCLIDWKSLFNSISALLPTPILSKLKTNLQLN
ncbi:HTTM domain-containing protein [Seonamhaeicola sp. NFXS20]|uniref:HTTM domain-containing protein n=1 Tax=Seonamhaeicola sp. NFXS20 TaxID=2816959 RepID=UPI003B8CA60D